MSEHVREKCGKLCFSSIISFKRGIQTPTKMKQIDDTQTSSEVQYITKPYAKVQLNMSKDVGEIAENCEFPVF